MIIPIHKEGICKFFTYILNIKLSGVLEENKLIHFSQIVFKEKHRRTDHIFRLKSLINSNVHNKPKRKMFGCFVDFSKGYCSVWHQGFSQSWNLITLKVYFLVFSKISTAKQNAQLNLLAAELISSTAKGESDKAAL